MSERPEPEERTIAELAVGEMLKISESLKALNTLGFAEPYLVALVHDDTKLAKGKIRAVLDSVHRISRDFQKTKKVQP
ncbi:MAG: hypothetical protein KAQ99_00790 [Candidatus Aureabacteria bacterium]|nr:hypothetical protein [Candidatus Auribacterota bacterium]